MVFCGWEGLDGLRSVSLVVITHDCWRFEIGWLIFGRAAGSSRLVLVLGPLCNSPFGRQSVASLRKGPFLLVGVGSPLSVLTEVCKSLLPLATDIGTSVRFSSLVF